MNRGVRLLLMAAGGIAGGALSETVWQDIPVSGDGVLVRLASAVIGVLLGAILLPRLCDRALAALRGASAETLSTTIAGLLIGLLASALAAYPLAQLNPPLGFVAPAVVAIVLTYLITTVLGERPHDVAEWWKEMRPTPTAVAAADGSADSNTPPRKSILLDTSVIIDGRITDISKTGFLTASLMVPNFVLNELQYIADSGDALRRKRGRRGLEVLNVLQAECPIPLEITDIDVSEVREVDSKLVALARHLSVPIMTNDYNLNRVAGLQGVTVLNINDLANAVKAAYLPGEELSVRVIQEGREHGQGVGYLEDGTMVVIEEGRYHINRTLDVVVTKVLQTSAGRMIFGKIVD